MYTLAEIFSPDGVLERHLPEFRFREAQRAMAELIWQSFETHEHAAIEAGTGIGKTYAYLIPVLLSGRRTIISTGTKTLQDQLYAKDLPALGAAIGRPSKVAVLKGRNNYLCWHRLELTLGDLTLARDARSMLSALREWGNGSSSGDLSELEDLHEDFALRSNVTSTVDNCLGAQCPSFDRCFVVEARRRAQAARVVIVNHHLLLADLALKEAGFGELLGDAQTVIVDEAHLLPDIAQQFFGLSVGTREVASLCADFRAELTSVGQVRSSVPELAELERGLEELRGEARKSQGRTPWSHVSPSTLDLLHEHARSLEGLAELAAGLDDGQPGIARCKERFDDIAFRLRHILESEGEDGLRWLEASPRALRLNWTPLELGEALETRIAEQAGNWVFTSATLAVGDDFNHFLSRIGLSGVQTAVLPSPFDYEHNARIYLPRGLPEPSRPDYVARLMADVWPLVEAAGGGAFLLFTSYRALHEAEEWLQPRIAPGAVLVQGAGSRSQLLEQFRATSDAVLLGTSSFWQGVDVKGSSLRVVVIEKLPFAAPNDPLVEARSQAIRRAGGDPFIEFQLPQAVLALKQGVGRLIRDYDDSGLIVIGDPRLQTRAYGETFLGSLPPAPRIYDFGEALSFAARLNPGSSEDGVVGHESALY